MLFLAFILPKNVYICHSAKELMKAGTSYPCTIIVLKKLLLLFFVFVIIIIFFLFFLPSVLMIPRVFF